MPRLDATACTAFFAESEAGLLWSSNFCRHPSPPMAIASDNAFIPSSPILLDARSRFVNFASAPIGISSVARLDGVHKGNHPGIADLVVTELEIDEICQHAHECMNRQHRSHVSSASDDLTRRSHTHLIWQVNLPLSETTQPRQLYYSVHLTCCWLCSDETHRDHPSLFGPAQTPQTIWSETA